MNTDVRKPTDLPEEWLTAEGVLKRDAFEGERSDLSIRASLRQPVDRDRKATIDALYGDFKRLDKKIQELFTPQTADIRAFNALRTDNPGYSPRLTPDIVPIGASLVKINLSGALIDGVRLDTNHLEGSDFRGATLIDVSFLDADLKNADFTGANLDGCDFTHANLSGAKITAEQLAKCLFYDAVGLSQELLDETLRILKGSVGVESSEKFVNIILRNMGDAVRPIVEREVTEGSSLLSAVNQIGDAIKGTSADTAETRRSLRLLFEKAVRIGVGKTDDAMNHDK